MIPRSVRVAGEYYEPVVLRIESVREHDGLPDMLTHITDGDICELSEDTEKNQFAVVLAKKGMFTERKADPKNEYARVIEGGEVLDMRKLLFNLMGGGKYQVIIRWNAALDGLELLSAQYGVDPKDGTEIVLPVAKSTLGEKINPTIDQRMITPHSFAAAVIRLLMASNRSAEAAKTLEIDKLPVVDPQTLEIVQEAAKEVAKEVIDTPDFNTQLLKSYPRSSAHPEEHTCPRGMEIGAARRAVWLTDDTCSYCGSIHPIDFMARLEAGTMKLEPTDKDYKVYVVNDGGEDFKQTYREDGSPGGNDPSKWNWTTRSQSRAKFYFQHLSQDQRRRFVELLNENKLKLDIPGHFYRLPFFCVPAK